MIKDSQDAILFFDHELACRHCGKLELAPEFDERLTIFAILFFYCILAGLSAC